MLGLWAGPARGGAGPETGTEGEGARGAHSRRLFPGQRSPPPLLARDGYIKARGRGG